MMLTKQEKFRLKMQRMEGYYGKKIQITETMMQVWWEDLSKFDGQIIEEAIDQAIKDSAFPPTLGKVLERAVSLSNARMRDVLYRRSKDGKLEQRMDPRADEKMGVIMQIAAGKITAEEGTEIFKEMKDERETGQDPEED